METELKKKPKHNKHILSEERFLEIKKLSNKIRGKYSGMIASVLVGRRAVSENNFRLIVLLDDLNTTLLNQTISDVRLAITDFAYETVLDVAADVVLVSQFWKGFQEQDEVMLEIVRNTMVIHDTGFFQPIQDLLIKGKIRPTKEGVITHLIKSGKSLKVANEHVAKAILDIYWAVTDAAHSAVMVAGITPPSPNELAGVIRTNFVVKGLINERCPPIIDAIYTKAKTIMHKEQFEFTGREYDKCLADADFFITEMQDFVTRYTKRR